jgi:hypothetical protein
MLYGTMRQTDLLTLGVSNLIVGHVSRETRLHGRVSRERQKDFLDFTHSSGTQTNESAPWRCPRPPFDGIVLSVAKLDRQKTDRQAVGADKSSAQVAEPRWQVSPASRIKDTVMSGRFATESPTRKTGELRSVALIHWFLQPVRNCTGGE